MDILLMKSRNTFTLSLITIVVFFPTRFQNTTNQITTMIKTLIISRHSNSIYSSSLFSICELKVRQLQLLMGVENIHKNSQ